MVHFVGAGSGAADLITVRGARLLAEADVIIYAGSLVNPELLSYAKPGCEIHNSATMTLEEVIAVMRDAEAAGKTTVRLHTGDSSIYGAVREQFDELEKLQISYDVCPGVSAFCGAAAALKAEYTLPASWREQNSFRCTVGTLHETVTQYGLTKTSLIVVGGCLGGEYMRSLLYHPGFSTEFREASE